MMKKSEAVGIYFWAKQGALLCYLEKGSCVDLEFLHDCVLLFWFTVVYTVHDFWLYIYLSFFPFRTYRCHRLSASWVYGDAFQSHDAFDVCYTRALNTWRYPQSSLPSSVISAMSFASSQAGLSPYICERLCFQDHILDSRNVNSCRIQLLA